MANRKYRQIYVQPVKDLESRPNAWVVVGKVKRGFKVRDQYQAGGRRMEVISDHRKKKPAVTSAMKKANQGQKIAIKDKDGQFLRWITKDH